MKRICAGNRACASLLPAKDETDVAVTRVHIERLVLDGLDLPAAARADLIEGVVAAIEQQVRTTPLPHTRSAAIPRLSGGSVEVDTPSRMGAGVGDAITRAIRG